MDDALLTAFSFNWLHHGNYPESARDVFKITAYETLWFKYFIFEPKCFIPAAFRKLALQRGSSPKKKKKEKTKTKGPKRDPENGTPGSEILRIQIVL